MLRKRFLKGRSIKPKIDTSELNITASACIVVTSESRDHPVQNAFDGHRGPGGSEWIAEGPGEQAIVLVFDSPQTIRRILFEAEEEEFARSQEVRLLISRNNGGTFDDLLRQGFNFSPPGTVFEREQWEVDIQEVTDLPGENRSRHTREIVPGQVDGAGLMVTVRQPATICNTYTTPFFVGDLRVNDLE